MGDGRPLRLAAPTARRAGAALLALALAALVFAPALDPGRRMAIRDSVQFHLPLYASFSRLATAGLPEWNPDLWGGQPVHSNPNYAALYPPTWLMVALEPTFGFQVGLVLHGLFAAAGAAWLVARLGGRASARWLAAIAFGGGAWALAIAHAGRSYFGLAWLPWLLVAAHATAAARDRRAAVRATLGLAGTTAGVALAGEPATILLALGAAALALLLGERPRRAVLARGAAAMVVGLLLAAVALVPALARLGDSARGEGISYRHSSLWSLAPARLVEVVFPRFFGDPARLEEGLFFGWTLHDKSFPYLFAITPGALLLVFGLAALFARREIPWRWVWRLGALASLLLALGRHNPLFAALWPVVPGLSSIRYPEKFFVGAVACLVLAGALAWSRLLDEREQGRRGEADLPAALAALAALVAGGLWALLRLRPELGAWFVTAMSPVVAGSSQVEPAARYLTAQAAWAAALYAAVAGIALAARARRIRTAWLAAAAVALFAGEQHALARRLFYLVPAESLRTPPALLAEVLAQPGSRFWSTAEMVPESGFFLRQNRREREIPLTMIERLDPSTGAIWGLRYALNRDYDLTLTGPARRALAAFEGCWTRGDRDLAYRMLGAWGIGRLGIVRLPPELRRLAAAAGGARPPLVEVVANPYFLPEARFVPAGAWHSTTEEAERAAFADRLIVPRREDLVGARPPGLERFDPAARVLAERRGGRGVEIRYRAAAPALLVVAQTFDVGWSAAVGAREVPLYETATGMLAAIVPPGEATAVLRYRDPWLRVGAGLSGLAALALAGWWLRARRGASPGA